MSQVIGVETPTAPEMSRIKVCTFSVQCDERTSSRRGSTQSRCRPPLPRALRPVLGAPGHGISSSFSHHRKPYSGLTGQAAHDSSTHFELSSRRPAWIPRSRKS